MRTKPATLLTTATSGGRRHRYGADSAALSRRPLLCDGHRKLANLRQEVRDGRSQVQGPDVQRDLGVPDHVTVRRLVSGRQAEGGAVGEHLVEVAMSPAAFVDLLVLGV